MYVFIVVCVSSSSKVYIKLRQIEWYYSELTRNIFSTPCNTQEK